MKMQEIKYGIPLFVLIFLISVAHPSFGAVSSLWEIGEVEEFLQGEFESVGVTTDGEVVPTWSSESVSLPARVAWGAALNDDVALVGTSGPAALFRVLRTENEDTPVKKLLQVNQLGFTALVESGGYLYAAAIPSGDIYRYDAAADTAVVVANVPDSHVFTMIPDRDNSGVYIGGGPDGGVYHLTREGEITKVSELADRSILSLVIYKGELYTGDNRGSVFRVEKGESPRPVYSFQDAEVNALAACENYIYLGVNRTVEAARPRDEDRESADLARALQEQMLQQGVEHAAPPTLEAPAQMKITGETPPEAATPGEAEPEEVSIEERVRQAIEQQEREQRAARMFTGKIGSAVIKMKPDQEFNILFMSQESAVNDIALLRQDLLVATGQPARVFKLGADGRQTVYMQTDREQLTEFKVSEGRLRAVVAAHGAGIYLGRDFDPGKNIYRTEIFDAGLPAHWGRAKTFFQGNVQFRVRGGVTSTPDTFWTDWSGWKSASTFETALPASRYMQLEVRFAEHDALLRKLEIAYRSPNQRPQIVAFRIAPDNIRDMILGRQDPDQDRSRLPREILNMLQNSSSERELAWQAMDPDGDQLRASLFYRPIDTGRWIALPEAQNLTQNSFKWNGDQFADGYYQIKLEVSDDLVNPPEESFTVSKTIGPVLVDNTAPRFRNIRVSDRQLRFEAVDDTSRIILAQYRVNAGDWNRMRPVDGIFDSPREEFSVSLPTATETGDLVEILIIDEAGNRSMASRVVK